MHLFHIERIEVQHNIILINTLHTSTQIFFVQKCYLFRKNDSYTKLKTIFVRLQYDIKAHE